MYKEHRAMSLAIPQENLRIKDEDMPIKYEVYEPDSGDKTAVITLSSFDSSCDFDRFFRYGHTLEIREVRKTILEGTIDDIDLDESELTIWINVR